MTEVLSPDSQWYSVIVDDVSNVLIVEYGRCRRRHRCRRRSRRWQRRRRERLINEPIVPLCYSPSAPLYHSWVLSSVISERLLSTGSHALCPLLSPSIVLNHLVPDALDDRKSYFTVSNGVSVTDGCSRWNRDIEDFSLRIYIL